MLSEMERVLALVLADAQTRRTNAGYGGRMDDGGASELETQVKFYRMGANGQMPPEWEEYLTQARHEADPEWVTYQRLRRKFE